MAKTTKTIEQRLKVLGYSHKSDANSVNDGRHVISNQDSKGGVVLGRFDAFEAMGLLRAEAKVETDRILEVAKATRAGVALMLSNG